MALRKISHKILLILSILSIMVLIASLFSVWWTNYDVALYRWLTGMLILSLVLLGYLLIVGKKISRIFLTVSVWVMFLCIAALTIFMIESMKATTCTGLFGVPQSCVDVAKFIVGFLFFNPLIFFTTVCASAVSLVVQLTLRK